MMFDPDDDASVLRDIWIWRVRFQGYPGGCYDIVVPPGVATTDGEAIAWARGYLAAEAEWLGPSLDPRSAKIQERPSKVERERHNDRHTSETGRGDGKIDSGAGDASGESRGRRKV